MRDATGIGQTAFCHRSRCNRCQLRGSDRACGRPIYGTCCGQFLAAMIEVTEPGRAMRDDDMLDLLILAAIIGGSFGLGYGTRELVSRQRRHRYRLRDWHGEVAAGPSPQLENPSPALRPAEPAGDFAIDLDRLQITANDDRANRHHQRSSRGPRVNAQIRRDELDVAVRDLLVELDRLSSHDVAPPRTANAERAG